MAWTASLPQVSTGNPTKASDYNNLLNNLHYLRDKATGNTAQVVVASGSDGTATAPFVKRSADGTGIYFAAGQTLLSAAGANCAVFANNQWTLVSQSGGNGLLVSIGAGGPAWPTGYTGVAVGFPGYNYRGFYVGPFSNAAVGGGFATCGLYVDTVTATVTNGGNTSFYGAYVGATTITTSSYSVNAYGLYAGAISTGTNTGSFAYGVYIASLSSAGTVAGLYIGSLGGSPASQSYGVYIGATTGSTFYPFYSVSTNRSYLGGALQIGNTDPGVGAASTTTFTGVNAAAGSTNTLTIKTAGTATQGPFLKVYVGTTAYYVPTCANA